MMYFYTDGGEKFGPLTFDQLLTKNLNQDTLIWKEGMQEWRKAGSFGELQEVFLKFPPPIPANKSSEKRILAQELSFVPKLVGISVAVGALIFMFCSIQPIQI